MNETKLFVVVIGRNEGEKLKKSINSVLSRTSNLIYVDSASSDDSVEYCQQINVPVLELDPKVPLSAARARNEGFEWIKQHHDNVEYIQFLDGDCILTDEWLDKASSFLSQNESAAIVCGVLEELYPERSIFNQICDVEWKGGIGGVEETGGIFFMRYAVFNDVRGFNQQLIAGEESEFCARVIEKGHDIVRVNEEMAYHDANITSWKQWWIRTLRSGHAIAQGIDFSGSKRKKVLLRKLVSLSAWGGAYPILLIAGLLLGNPFNMVVLAAPWVLFFRVFSNSLRNKNCSIRACSLYSFSVVIGKLPQFFGVLTFYHRKLSKARPSRLIEYK